jgi:hypothetical protein
VRDVKSNQEWPVLTSGIIEASLACRARAAPHQPSGLDPEVGANIDVSKYMFFARKLMRDGRCSNVSKAARSGMITFQSVTMPTPSILLLVGVATILVVRLLRIGHRPKGYPPGPPTLPILGNIHQVRECKNSTVMLMD